ncbi:MAG: hypothetical protein IKP69_04195, partial [Oscillospiraceae bacterium]|nr:hypothetical protein [Oscillospiraceae bacterium]
NMAELQSNAYPYSNPVLTDDGNVMLYLSDNNNPKKPESVVCYAVKTENGYELKGAIDTSTDNILADTDVVASGSDNQYFAAWVKQMDSPEKEMKDAVTYDDLGMMLNATEIYGSVYNGTEWTTQPLTDNTVADMSPTIASSGNNAIVAWRSLSATSMPEEGKEQDLTAMFNAENNINYRIYDSQNNTWKEAQVAYNGTAGTVNAINSAMLQDGTALLVYSVRTGEDVTSTETFYTLINPNGEVVTTGRLTNDGYTDTNVQVAAVGSQFVVGWYSEHAAGEEGATSETVVSHDIGLARINKDGSVDASFPESIGATSAAAIGSDFHFSAPAGNDDLNNLSIVWSQKKDSDSETESNKYLLNAVRFYQEGSNIRIAAPTTIAESSQNYVIDHFDTYTENDGTVNAVLLGSDYNTDNGGATSTSVYDTIDLTDLPIQVINDNGETSNQMAILTRNPVASIKLAKGKFPETAIEAVADMNLHDLMPDSNFPVQFTVKNTGTSKVDTIDVNIAGQTKSFSQLNLLPGQSTVLTVSYPVPSPVSDVDYTLTANNTGTATGKLVLNRPDVGITSMKVTRESDKTRDIQVILGNASEIPLAGSGKTVKLAFYKDMNHEEQIGTDITIDSSAYQDIDNDIYILNKTFDVTDFIGNAEEVPDEGVRLYARAWVEDVEELYTLDNDSAVTFKGLLSKYQSQITMDSALTGDETNGYKVVADISNNSLQPAEIGAITADILDSKHKVLASVPLYETALTLDGEHTEKLTATVPELTGTPVSVSLRSSTKSVLLDAGDGFCDAVTISLTKDNKP